MHVPDGWKYEKLGKISNAVTSGSRDWAQYYSESGSKFIRMTNLSRDGIHLKLDDLKYVKIESESTDGKRTSLISGDILVSITAELGKIGWVPENIGDAFINQHISLVRINHQKANSMFIAYMLSSRRMNDVINRLNDAGAKAGLNLPTIKALPIILPPIPEQQKIAQILSTWDKAIEKLETLIAAKQKRKKALSQQLLTGKKRFSEHVTSLQLQTTRYGAIPAEWQYLHIGEVARQISQKNNQSTNLPVLSCTKHYGLVDSLTYFGKRIFSEDTSTYKIVPRNAFAYATNHIEEGSIGYQNLYDEALISPMYTVFKTNGNIDDDFLYRLLKTELYRHIFEVNTSASVDRRGSLRWNEFSQIKIPVPSILEQQKIASVLAAADQEIEVLQKQLTALKEQKKGLMQQLLTGKKRVSLGEAA